MNHRKIVLVLSIFFLISCSKSPEKINYGFDSCEHCQMNIVEPKFASELITSKGKVYKFDSIECLAAFYSEQKKENIYSAYVSVLDNENFYSIEEVTFLLSELKSPMGLNLSAISNSANFDEYQKKYSAKTLEWKEVIEYVNKNWNE